MFRIGDFARLSRVSVKMLRHYADLGLLPPAWVDPVTDYRYYSADQLPRLNRILAFKELGFSLAQVARLLDAELSAEQLRMLLLARRSELEQHLEAGRARLNSVEQRLTLLERDGGPSSYEVVLRAVAPEAVASIRARLDAPDRVERLFDEVETWATRRRCRAPQPPLMLYHDERDEPEVEVAVPVLGAPRSSGTVTVYELPPIDSMACVVHTGSYATLVYALEALYRWCEAHDRVAIGPLRERYLRFGAAGTDVRVPPAFLTDFDAEFVTELQLPVMHGVMRDE
jgi:DNA-binding transcriptional MerR regulator